MFAMCATFLPTILFVEEKKSESFTFYKFCNSYIISPLNTIHSTQFIYTYIYVCVCAVLFTLIFRRS
jgi:hypothetical protein